MNVYGAKRPTTNPALKQSDGATYVEWFDTCKRYAQSLTGLPDEQLEVMLRDGSRDHYEMGKTVSEYVTCAFYDQGLAGDGEYYGDDDNDPYYQ